jgi:uncharacterized membrane protein YfhO
LQTIAAPNFNARLTAVIEKETPAEVLHPSSLPPLPISEASIVNYSATRVTIEVDNPQPGYLVLTDTFYPGWRATVDEESAPILRANYLFRAVSLPVGRHTVVFTFRPMTFHVGAAASLVGVLVVASYLARALYGARYFGHRACAS